MYVEADTRHRRDRHRRLGCGEATERRGCWRQYFGPRPHSAWCPGTVRRTPPGVTLDHLLLLFVNVVCQCCLSNGGYIYYTYLAAWQRTARPGCSLCCRVLPQPIDIGLVGGVARARKRRPGGAAVRALRWRKLLGRREDSVQHHGLGDRDQADENAGEGRLGQARNQRHLAGISVSATKTNQETNVCA